MVSVDGRLTRRSYVSKDGKQVYTTEIVIESISIIAKSKTTENAAFNKIYSETIEAPKNESAESVESIAESLEAAAMKGDNE
jgi:single-stranded DNA-binding protein